MLVFLLQKILSLLVLLWQNIMLLCHYAEQKRIMDNCTSHFHLLVLFCFSFNCLFVYSVKALCACSVSSPLFLMKFKRHLWAWNMN